MTRLRKIFAGVAMVILAGGVAAGDQSRENYQLCKASVRQALGEETRLRLFNIHNRRGGDRYRLKAIPASGEGFALNCWVSTGGEVSLETLDGVALQVRPEEAGEQVTATH